MWHLILKHAKSLVLASNIFEVKRLQYCPPLVHNTLMMRTLCISQPRPQQPHALGWSCLSCVLSFQGQKTSSSTTGSNFSQQIKNKKVVTPQVSRKRTIAFLRSEVLRSLLNFTCTAHAYHTYVFANDAVYFRVTQLPAERRSKLRVCEYRPWLISKHGLWY